MANITITLGNTSASLSPQDPSILIGRADQADLVTQIAGVSRRHAEVFLQQGTAFIRNLGSVNGTWVDGEYAQDAVALAPGKQVFIGQTPLKVEWTGGPVQGATMMVDDMPALIQKAMEARKAHLQGGGAMVPAPMVPASAPMQGSPAAAAVQDGGTFAPNPAEFPYRRQGSNNNGVILVALRRDTFSNGEVLDGYLEFTATDNERIASITCELVEVHKKGPKKGHVWDRMIVRQGPWKAKTGDVLPMPFQLRVPAGTSISGRDCHWEVRAYVDIDWAFDIECDCEIKMRNVDIERLRNGLGALDYRMNDIGSDPLGQHFSGSFQPPANVINQVGIKGIGLDVTYLGTTVKVELHVGRKGVFKFDRKSQFVLEINQLRSMPPQQVSSYFQNAINELMA